MNTKAIFLLCALFVACTLAAPSENDQTYREKRQFGGFGGGYGGFGGGYGGSPYGGGYGYNPGPKIANAQATANNFGPNGIANAVSTASNVRK